MKEYREMTSQELTALREELRQEYSEIQARGLSLNMARGKPGRRTAGALLMPVDHWRMPPLPW